MNDSDYRHLSVFLMMLFISYMLGCSSNQAVINEKADEETGSTTLPDTNWQVTFLHHTVFSNISLESLNGDTLSVLYRGTVKTLSVDSITELRFVKQSRFFERILTGAKIGAVVGAVLAALIVNPSSSGNPPYSKTEIQIFGRLIAAVFFGLEGGVLGGLVGGIADLILAQDEALELSRIPPAQKSNIIRVFLSSHGSSRFHVAR
jgi:gas vesicle protein